VAATILCADSDRAFCRVMARALTEAGYRVETAHDGPAALERTKALRPALVMLDVMLPKLDGFSVLEAIRSERSVARTPVAFVSGATFTSDYEARAKRLSAAAVLKKPVPLERLLSLAGSVAGKASVGEPTALDGRIEEVSFAELLHHLHGLRATGVLEMLGRKRRKQVQLRNGVPEAVRSNLMHETLGQLLLASGTISEDVLASCVTRMKSGGGLLGQILVASQMLDEEHLARALHHQAEEKLYELFTWTRGEFRFHRGVRIRGANALYLNRSPADLVMHGVLERMPIAAIDTRLAQRAACLVKPSGNGFYEFQGATLGAEAQALVALIDGRRTLAELSEGGEQRRRLLFALVVLEILELEERSAAAAPRAATAMREPRSRTAEPASAATSESLRAELAKLAQRIGLANPWEALDVVRDASDEQIRAAYADLAKRIHPDRFIGAPDSVRRLAEELFGRAAAAYDAIRDADARAAWQRAQEQSARDEEARAESERAVFAEREFTRGEALLRAKRVTEALHHFRAAVEAYPDEGEYHVYYGWAYYLTAPDAPGRIDRAIELVMKGRKLIPDRRTPYLFLARLSQAAGRFDHAEKMYARAIQIDPDCVEAVRELRLVRTRQDKAKGIVRRMLGR
jgi:CheY-like chemotaxis protein